MHGRLRINVDPLFRACFSSRTERVPATKPTGLELRIETRARIADLVSDGFDLAVRFESDAVGTDRPSCVRRARFDSCLAHLHQASRKAAHPRDFEGADHQCIQAIDPSTGRSFDWEFWRGNEKLSVAVNGRLTVTDSV